MSPDGSPPNPVKLPRPCPRCPHRLSDLVSHVEPSEDILKGNGTAMSELSETANQSSPSEVANPTRPAELSRRKSVRFELGPAPKEATSQVSSTAKKITKRENPFEFDDMLERLDQASTLMDSEEAELEDEEMKASFLTREDLESINEALREAEADPPSYTERKEGILVDMSPEQLEEKAKSEFESVGSSKATTPKRGILTKGRSNSDVKKKVRFHEDSKPESSEVGGSSKVRLAGKNDLRDYLAKMSRCDAKKESTEKEGNGEKKAVRFRDESEVGEFSKVRMAEKEDLAKMGEEEKDSEKGEEGGEILE